MINNIKCVLIDSTIQIISLLLLTNFELLIKLIVTILNVIKIITRLKN